MVFTIETSFGHKLQDQHGKAYKVMWYYMRLPDNLNMLNCTTESEKIINILLGRFR